MSNVIPSNLWIGHSLFFASFCGVHSNRFKSVQTDCADPLCGRFNGKIYQNAKSKFKFIHRLIRKRFKIIYNMNDDITCAILCRLDRTMVTSNVCDSQINHFPMKRAHQPNSVETINVSHVGWLTFTNVRLVFETNPIMSRPVPASGEIKILCSPSLSSPTRRGSFALSASLIMTEIN